MIGDFYGQALTLHSQPDSVAARRSSGLVLFALVVLLGPSATIVRGQGYLSAIGVPPFTTASPVENGFINLANGNLHLDIPLGTYAQRAGGEEKIVLRYDSAIWLHSAGGTGYAGAWYPSVGAGWVPSTSSGDASGVSQSQMQSSQKCTYYKNGTWYTYPEFTQHGPFVFFEPFTGTQHTFNIITKQPNFPQYCPNPNVPTGSQTDSFGYRMDVASYSNPTVYAPDGTVYVWNGSAKDANGNFYTYNYSGIWTDTVGRNVLSETPCCVTPTTLSVLNSQGSTSTYTLTWQTINVCTNFQDPPHASLLIVEYCGTMSVLQKIQLPDGTAYSFTYDFGTTPGHYGTMTSMTLPTGTTINYAYVLLQDATPENFLWITSRQTPDGTWNYSGPSSSTNCYPSGTCQQVTVTKPNGDQEVYEFLMSSGGNPTPWLSKVQAYTGSASSGALLATTEACYGNVTVSGGGLSCGGGGPLPPYNKTALTTILPVPGGNVTRSDVYTWDTTYPFNLDKLQEWNFYGATMPASPDRTTTYSYLSGSNYVAKNILKRVASVTVTGGGTIAQTNYSYDGSALVSATGMSNHDDTNYGTGNTVRGNLTQVQRLVSGSTYLTNSMSYDMTGQVRTSTDSNSNTTQYDYTDNFYTDPGDGQGPIPKSVSPPTNAYLKTITYPTVNSVTLTQTLGYYWGTGQVALSTDENSNTTYFHFYDSLNRPTSTALPNGGWTMLGYNSTDTQVDAYTGSTNASASKGCTVCRHDQKILDGLGRVASNRLVNDPDGATYVASTFDSNGRVATVSIPYRGSPNGVETSSYDGLDRTTQVKHADNNIAYTYYGANAGTSGGAISQLCSSSTYGYGYPILVVDEAGKKRQTWKDGFGRVIETDEPGSSGSLTVGTCYTYDLNNNLTQVTSLGLTQTRKPTYTYDMLSRMTSKSPTESSGTTYFYYTTTGSALCSGDPSEVCRITAARGITTTYGYDAMNRLGAKTYSDATPASYYYYDTPACTTSNPKGHLINMGTYNGTSWLTGQCFSYDAIGDVISTYQRVGSQSQTISYTYNLDGSISSVTYPGGRTVSYAEGNAQRATQLADTTNHINYVTAPSSSAMYAPQGALANAIHGYVSGGFAGITESYTYNNRLEVTGIQATSSAGTPLNLAYTYVSGNNGNISQQTNNVSNGRTQSYTYDPLNRLLTAQTQATSGADCWGQSFGSNGPPPTLAADALANLFYASATQCSAPSEQFTMNPSNNDQISGPGSGFGYDADGNMWSDSTWSYTYDAENHIIIANASHIGPYCYTYDAFGLRVMKAHANGGSCTGTPTVDMQYWRDTGGNTIAETDGTGSTTNSNYNEYVFFAGRRIAQSNPSSGNVYYYFADHLGSTRVVTTATGTACFEVDYLPYGYENTPSGFSNTCSTRYRFTGWEEDAETAFWFSPGLHYAFARYYSSTLQRFLTPDPAGDSVADASNPQSWNMYSYVLNNPLNAIDPNGLDCVYLAGGPTPGNLLNTPIEFLDHNSDGPECWSNGGYWANGYVANSPSSVIIDPNSDTIGIFSTDANGNTGLSIATQNWTQNPGTWSTTFTPSPAPVGPAPPTNQQYLMAVKVSGMMASHGMACAGKAFVSNEIPFGDNLVGKGTMGSNARELATQAATHPFATSRALDAIDMPNIGHVVVSAEKHKGIIKALKVFDAADPALKAYGFAQDMGACYGNPDE